MTLAAEGLLTDEQLHSYEELGYLQLDSFVSEEWLDRLRAASAEFVEQSRSLSESTQALDLEPSHTADAPRLRRLTSPFLHHETFREFTLEGPPARLAQALLGGPARFHHSKLNYKWADGGEEIKWHQDIQFWPHTDFTPLTIGVYLEDVDDEMGPMGVLPRSHRGPLFDMYGSDGRWAGSLNDADIATLDLEPMAWLQGPAGSTTVHNCCMIHGSVPNNSARPRPLLLQTYSAIDSYPVAGIGANGMVNRTGNIVVGGDATQNLTIDRRIMHGAPDWSAGGTPTIFGSQHSKT